MSEKIKLLLIAGALIAVVAFIAGGRYTVRTSEHGFVYVVDRFTGSTTYCFHEQCGEVLMEKENPYAQFVRKDANAIPSNKSGGLFDDLIPAKKNGDLKPTPQKLLSDEEAWGKSAPK
jgi:hypothetical protein